MRPLPSRNFRFGRVRLTKCFPAFIAYQAREPIKPIFTLQRHYLFVGCRSRVADRVA
jgi:hypothetical protein